jgi:hypothetical protein
MKSGSADQSILSEKDEIPLAELKASKPREDSEDSASEEDNIPLSVLKGKLEKQALHDGRKVYQVVQKQLRLLATV